MRSAMLGLIPWGISCMGFGAPTPSVAGELAMLRCTDPLHVELQVQMATGSLQFSGPVCGSPTGILVLESAVPPDLRTAEDLLVRGGYQRSGEQFKVDLRLIQEDQTLGHWTGKEIPTDGSFSSLQAQPNEGSAPFTLTLSVRSFPSEESELRVDGTLPAAQMATRLATLADWQLEGVDLLPPVNVTLSFEIVELYVAMQLISEDASVYLKRTGPRSVRFLNEREAKRP